MRRGRVPAMSACYGKFGVKPAGDCNGESCDRCAPKPVWGVFKWDSSNMYLGRNAVKRYVRLHAAENYAEKSTFNENGWLRAEGTTYVVRRITRE